METQKLTRAGALLDKARATPFPGEQEALAVRAYTLLAAYLNSIEVDSGSEGRRRERRLLVDRRQAAAANTTDLRTPHPVADPSAYRTALQSYRSLGSSLDIAL
jgi:hypothetical protein